MSHQTAPDGIAKMPARFTTIDCVIPAGRPCTLIAIPDDLYKKLMSEVMALPEKKRGKWKSFLHDKRGTRTRVRYSDGKLENYSNLPAEDGACYLQCVHGWMEVANEDEMPKGTVQVSAFSKWAKELETTAPDLTEADKLEIWAEMTKSDREHTNPRAGGGGKHGEVKYSWCKGKQ